MAIFPSHADLDDLVQFEQGAVLDLDTSPDRRLDVGQGDLELIDGRLRLWGFSRRRSLCQRHSFFDRESLLFTINRIVLLVQPCPQATEGLEFLSRFIWVVSFILESEVNH